MAHNLATIDGKVAMAYQGETPWHKLGIRMDGVQSISAAMSAATLDWQVGVQPLYLADGREVPRRRAVVRDVDSAILGCVSTDYRVIQNSEAFGIFQPAMDEFGLTVECAGALGKGEKVWMLFRLPTTVSPIPGDDVNGYGVAITGHDGSICCEFRPTPIRVVCQNTLNLAVGKGGEKGRIFGIDHSGNVEERMKAAKAVVSGALAAMQETGETFASMARKALTPQQVINYIEAVFPADKDGKVSDAQAERRATVADLVWTGVGAELAMSATLGEPNPWAVYNAVTEYFDHLRKPGVKDSTIASANQSAVFGRGNDIKLLALSKARELVAA